MNTQRKIVPSTSEPRSSEQDESILDTARAAVEAALDRKAMNPVLMDVRSLASYTDYVLVVSGRSDRQVQAISDGVKQALVGRGLRPLGIEGDARGQWALVDFGDVVMHVFHHPVREVYDLESLWIDAPRVKLDLPPEALVPAHETY